jgi:biopolymer transport protein ExbD
MAGGAQKDDDELITQINVTPLVDVVLVLLIILMVTASYIASHQIPLELPNAETGEDPPPPDDVLPISINSDGQLFIDAEPITEDQFRPRIRSYLAGLPNRAQARATIAADGRIAHSLFIRVIDILRDEQVSRFAINVRPEDLEQ